MTWPVHKTFPESTHHMLRSQHFWKHHCPSFSLPAPDVSFLQTTTTVGQLGNQLVANQYFLFVQFRTFSFPPGGNIFPRRKLSRFRGSTQDQVWAPPSPPPLHAHNRAISVNRALSVSTRPRQRISTHSHPIVTI